jgi:hypothetical protein
LTLSTLNFLNSGGANNHYVGGALHHFGKFFFFTSFDERIDMVGIYYDIFLSPYELHTIDFISRQLFAALASAPRKSSASVIAWTVGGGSGF